jgi:regulator of cell morphogenesis and NO signaling
MNRNSMDELIENSKMYQMVTERLEVVDPLAENLAARFDMEADLMELILDLYSSGGEELSGQKLRNFSIDQVISYLQASHKLYLSKKLPEIEQTMVHIFNKYSQTHQLLTALTIFFNDYKNRLVAHIRMEERDFFPFIKRLSLASKNQLDREEVAELLKNNSIAAFDDNHDPIEDDLKKVSTLIHSYSKDTETPLPYRVFLNQVEIFELELRKHAFIEDHILVPMAKEIEAKLLLLA